MPWSWTDSMQPQWRPPQATSKWERRIGRSGPTRGLVAPPQMTTVAPSRPCQRSASPPSQKWQNHLKGDFVSMTRRPWLWWVEVRQLTLYNFLYKPWLFSIYFYLLVFKELTAVRWHLKTWICISFLRSQLEMWVGEVEQQPHLLGVAG